MLFVLEIDEDWIDVLDSVTNSILSNPDSTVEEAMEVIVFFQIKLQLVRNAGKSLVNRAVHPLPQTECL